MCIRDRRTVKSVDEYLSRIAKAKEVLGKDSVELSEIIENNKNNLEQSLLEIGKFVQTALDHIQISDEELESASQQLKLFTNGTDEAIEYAEKELKGLEEGTYWARYWSGLLSRLKS